MNEQLKVLNALSEGMVSVLLAIAIGEDDERVAQASRVMAEYLASQMDDAAIEACKRRALKMVEAADRARVTH